MNTRLPQTQRSVLLLIDLQQGFEDPRWGERNQPHLEQNVQRLIAAARQNGVPVIHVHHHSRSETSPLHPQNGDVTPMPCAQPLSDEIVLKKHENSAFVGTPLREILTRARFPSLTLAGLTTDHCVSTTARFAANFGFDVNLLSDCCATFNRNLSPHRSFSADQIHEVHLASLSGEFARVLTLEEWLAEFDPVCKTQRHPLTSAKGT